MVLDSTSAFNNPTVKSFYQEMEIAEKTKNVEKSQVLTLRNTGVAIPLSFGAAKAGIQSWEYQKQTAEINTKQRQKQFAAQLENALNQYKQNVQQYDCYSAG